MNVLRKIKGHPASWVPTLYFAEALPYVAVMTVSVILYKRLGLSNTDIALYTGWLYLPWVIKPFWSPFVGLFKQNRWWIIATQVIIGFAFAGIAFSIPTSFFFNLTLAFFWLIAFTSATHDIVADGFYIQALDSHRQSYYVGIRSTFYRLSTLFGQGVLVIIAGIIESNTGYDPVNFKVEVDPFYRKPTELILPQFPDSISNSKSQCVLLTNSSIVLNPEAQGCDSVGKTISLLKDSIMTLNAANNFIVEEKKEKTETKKKELSVFERWIKDTFGEKTSVSNSSQIGNIAIIGIRLSCPPDKNESVVLQIEFDEGDKSIGIDDNLFLPRFTFDESNWDKTAYLIIKVDPKIQEPTFAIFKGTTGNISLAWSVVFGILSILFIIICIYHHLILPHPKNDIIESKGNNPRNIIDVLKEFVFTLKSFICRPQIVSSMFFMLLFRFPEAQLVKLSSPFMLDNINNGGLALTTGQVGLVYGTIGMLGLTLGGILGGIVVAKGGLKKWLWPMVLSISLPDLVYVWLSYTQNNDMFAVNFCVFIEQFGYGFGFTAYMLYLIYFSRGDRSTSVYAICTALMALGMMLPGMMAGWLEDLIGYRHFFVWVVICCFVTFIVTAFLKIDPEFGKKTEKETK